MIGSWQLRNICNHKVLENLTKKFFTPIKVGLQYLYCESQRCKCRSYPVEIIFIHLDIDLQLFFSEKWNAETYFFWNFFYTIFVWLFNSKAVTKFTSVHLMYRCTPTITGRIRPLYRKVSSDSAPQRIVGHLCVLFTDKERLIFIVEDQAVTSLSKTKQIWVCFLISIFKTIVMKVMKRWSQKMAIYGIFV